MNELKFYNKGGVSSDGRDLGRNVYCIIAFLFIEHLPFECRVELNKHVSFIRRIPNCIDNWPEELS